MQTAFTYHELDDRTTRGARHNGRENGAVGIIVPTGGRETRDQDRVAYDRQWGYAGRGIGTQWYIHQTNIARTTRGIELETPR